MWSDRCPARAAEEGGICYVSVACAAKKHRPPHPDVPARDAACRAGPRGVLRCVPPPLRRRRRAPAPAACRSLTPKSCALRTGGWDSKQALRPVQHGQVLLALVTRLRGARGQAAQPMGEAGLSETASGSLGLGDSLPDDPHLLSVTAESGGSNALFELVPEYRDLDLRPCA